MLPDPSSRSTIFDDELSLRWFFPCHIILPWTTSLVSSLCRTRGSNTHTLHHFLCLMSSLINYIFMKPLDKCASSSSFQTFPGYQPNSWWEIPSLPPRWIFAEPVGPILIFPLLKLYDLFYKLFPMGPCVSKVRPFPDDHVNAIPKHVCGTPNINKNIGSAMR